MSDAPDGRVNAYVVGAIGDRPDKVHKPKSAAKKAAAKKAAAKKAAAAAPKASSEG
jgi:hypothetical protein